MCINPSGSNNVVVLHKQFEDDVVFSLLRLEYESFWFGITNDVEDSMLENLGNSEIYDEMCLFEKNTYSSKFLHNINFTCSNKESI